MGGIVAPAITDYPTYLQDIHSSLLTGDDPTGGLSTFGEWGNITDSFYAATAGVGGSPYAGVEAYDPTDEIDAVQTRYDTWETAIDDIVPTTNVPSYVSAADTAADALVPSSQIDDVVDAFEARSNAAYLRNVSRFASGMFDIGAVVSTQFGMGLAAMELDRQDQLNDVDARLRLLAERERFQAVFQLTSEISSLAKFQLEQQRLSVGGRSDMSRIAIAAYQDQIGLNLKYEHQDATWDLDLFNYPFQALTALSGAVQLHKQQTPAERLAASVLTAGSFAINAGTATGNFGVGIAAGVLSLGTQLLTGIA